MTPPSTTPPSPLWSDPRLRAWVRRRLLAWFEENRRDLPWRHTRNPYAIWVSEVMLQQTQVATVVPYFQRFLAAFPTIRALAEAPEQQVLRLWEGLGYYRRARSLHQAAQLLVTHHDGQFPNDPEIVSSLPGFGRYTVGAVLSQAFERRLPIIEANSRRVLCRFLALRGDSRSREVETTLWDAATALLPRRAVGAFNQAVMELGALICTVSNPQCEECPLQARCQAYQQGVQDSLPERQPGRPLESVQEVAVVIERADTVLLVQLPATAQRWANLWEFPRSPLQPGETPEATAMRITDLLGIEADIGGELLTVRHGVTRFQITLIALTARYRGGEFSSNFYQQHLWSRREQLPQYPVSSPQRKLAQAVGDRHLPALF